MSDNSKKPEEARRNLKWIFLFFSLCVLERASERCVLCRQSVSTSAHSIYSGEEDGLGGALSVLLEESKGGAFCVGEKCEKRSEMEVEINRGKPIIM